MFQQVDWRRQVRLSTLQAEYSCSALLTYHSGLKKQKTIDVIYCNVTDETITNMKHGHTCGLSWSSWSSRKWLHSTLAKSSSKPTSMALSALTSSLSLYSLKCIKQNRDKVMRRAEPQTTGVAAAVRVESANRKVDPCLHANYSWARYCRLGSDASITVQILDRKHLGTDSV